MRALIADKMHESLFPMLDNLEVNYDYQPEVSREEIRNSLNKYEILFIRSKTFVDEDLLTNAQKLKYICRAGAGLDNLDAQTIESKEIKIINAPEGNRNALAEHCIGLLFSLLNNIVKSDKEIRRKIWNREGNRGNEIAGKTIGILGYGFMGQAFVNKLRPFNCEILVHDKYKTGFATGTVKESQLDEIFAKADILSIHLPLTEETKFMIDEAFLYQFEKPIWLINTSRGEILSLEALKSGLDKGQILGAALDVLENEKIDTFAPHEEEIFNFLVNSEDVILTPHVGGWTHESYKMINEVLIEKLKKELN